MGAGANTGSFAAGFGKGLSSALLHNQERSDRKKREATELERQKFSIAFPQFLQYYTGAEGELDAFMAQFPSMTAPGGGKSKKGESPWSNIGKFLGPLIGMRKPSVVSDDPNQGGITGNLPHANQPAGVTGGTLDSILTPNRPSVQGGNTTTMDQVQQPAAPPTGSGIYDLPGQVFSQDASVTRTPIGQTDPTSPFATGTGMPSAPAPSPNRRSILGIPLLTPSEKFERQEQQTEQQVAARRRLAERLGLPPAAAMAYALTGELTSAKPAEGFTLSPDQVRYGPDGKEIARGLPKAETANVPNTIDEAIVTAHAAGNQAEVERLLALKAKSSAAGREPKGAQSDEATAIAEMAADNPTTLQGLTPTLTGQAMAALKRNPQLYARYEAVRMKPIRQTATTMIDAIKKLVVVDEKTGKVTGLTPGGKAMFGEWTPAMARGLVMGQAGTDAAAALAQLTGQQVLDTIAEMKRQSKTGATGFGAMNIAELNVLESAATQLKKRLSEPGAQQELEKLLVRYQQILADSEIEIKGKAGATGSGAPGAPGAGQPTTPGAIAGPEWRDGKLYVNGVPIG